ncbi:hypothetical protein HPB48_017393 [Haemaphysalis longicornis]|uniref:Egal-1 winged helix domain-containing protein n=1 Tax=Haemaphysalis longicornis TaxID=44386 RepID=A0A9J6GJZ8_HAELO|nr:hypothetical protein HPB48_017393 [Haemaphysalis longicornis]
MGMRRTRSAVHLHHYNGRKRRRSSRERRSGTSEQWPPHSVFSSPAASSTITMKFLKERVESKQGISLQRLTGHLSQLPSDLKTRCGCSIKSLKRFLQQFPEVFAIRDERNVYVRKKGLRGTSSLSVSVQRFITSTLERDTDKEGVKSPTGVKGTLFCIFGVYGCIAIKYPIKTSVYFDAQSFENAKHRSLLSSRTAGATASPSTPRSEQRSAEPGSSHRVTRASIDKLSSSASYFAP